MERLVLEVKKALQLPNAEITNICLAGGMTNLNYAVTVDGKQYIIRMPGNGTQSMINRQEEKDNLELASKIGINPRLCYFDVETGLKITEKVDNAITIDSKSAKYESTMIEVGKILSTLHLSGEKMKNDFNLFSLIERYEQLARLAGAEFYAEFDDTKQEIEFLKERFEALNIKTYPCHIDPACSNFLTDKQEGFYLIDWEYSGMFDPIWDLAAYILESELSMEQENFFLQAYFQRPLNVQERERILLHKIFQDFLWSIWTLYKEEEGDHFGTYGEMRFERACRNIQLYKEQGKQNNVS